MKRNNILIAAVAISVVVAILVIFWPSENQVLLNTILKNLKLIAPEIEFTLSENKLSDNTFTLEKKFIFICLKNKNLNTLMYVAIHELAHIISNDYGHTPEFVTNFQGLLRKAMQLNVYTFVDYTQQNEQYCNMTLNTSVLR